MTTAIKTSGNLVQVAPGVLVDKAIAGNFTSRRRLMLLDDDGYQMIGLNKSHADTVRRLFESGFIRLCMVSPRVWFLDVDSWEDHIDKCLEDPWKWDRDGEALKKYRETYR